MSTTGSSELVLRDGGDATSEGTQGGLPSVQVPPGPSAFAKQLNKLNNVVFSSFLVSLIRAWTIPAEELPSARLQGNLPAWFKEGYRSKGRLRYMGQHVFRDTGYLTAAAYLMEGVESALHGVRGKDDYLNKVAGGLAAGGFMGYAWFPTRPYSRTILGATGALVGYLSYSIEKNSQAALLEQQHKLEKEVLGAREDQFKSQLDLQYLRQLIRMRQKQLVDAAEALRKSGGGPLVAGQPIEQSTAQPDWVQRGMPSSGESAGQHTSSDGGISTRDGSTSSGDRSSSSSYGSIGQHPNQQGSQQPTGSSGGTLSAWDVESRGQQALNTPELSSVQRGADDSRPGGDQRGGRSPGGGFLGGLWGKGNRQKPPADTVVVRGGEMQIREASDDEIQSNEMKQNAVGGMIIREEQDAPKR